MKEEKIIEQIKGRFPDALAIVKKLRRIEVKLASSDLFDFAVRMQKDWDFEHLSAISCVDWIDDSEFELVYHFWSYTHKILVMAKIRIEREETSHFKSITSLWQSAKFFERDIHEMFNIVFDGNEDLSRFILTDWNGPAPMRKDFQTREFALDFFTFKDDYQAEWMKDLKARGEKS